MLVNDYLVKQYGDDDWTYVKEATSAEVAVNSVVGEGVLSSGCGVDLYFFTGLKTDKKYIAYLVKKIYLVSVKCGDVTQIISVKSDVISARGIMKEASKFYSVCDIKEMILDDPRE